MRPFVSRRVSCAPVPVRVRGACVLALLTASKKSGHRGRHCRDPPIPLRRLTRSERCDHLLGWFFMEQTLLGRDDHRARQLPDSYAIHASNL